MKEGSLRPLHLIDVKRVPGLDALALGADGTITIGAAVPHRAVETSPLVREHLSLLAGAARAVEPVDDRHGSAEYKREMTRVFVRRALQAAVAHAEGREPHERYAHTVLV